MTRQVKRILLVEPEGVLAEITAFRLELLGYSVETVATPAAALKKIPELRPDVIITDLILENTDATGFIETLASNEDSSGIPVMVLSIEADLDLVTAAHKAGAMEFLLVPFHPEALEVKVARLAARENHSKDEGRKDKAAIAE